MSLYDHYGTCHPAIHDKKNGVVDMGFTGFNIMRVVYLILRKLDHLKFLSQSVVFASFRGQNPDSEMKGTPGRHSIRHICSFLLLCLIFATRPVYET